MLSDEAITSLPGARAVFARIADVFLTQALSSSPRQGARGILDVGVLSEPATDEVL